MIDLDDNRLKLSKKWGATNTINSGSKDAAEIIMNETKDSVDVAIKAVRVPASFDICQQIVRPGGHVTNIGAWAECRSANSRSLDSEYHHQHGVGLHEYHSYASENSDFGENKNSTRKVDHAPL